MFEVGETEVVFTATDAAGNVTTCSFTVTVEDNEDPVITCPADINQTADTGICGSATVDLGQATATDNCDNNPNCGGIIPVSLLWPNPSDHNSFKLDNSTGISPVKSLWPKPNCPSFSIWPYSGGMLPVNLFP